MSDTAADKAAALARESSWGPEAWQHALNALGDRADELLPTVKNLCARQGITPYASACIVIGALDDTST